MEVLSVFAEDCDADILCVSEHWLKYDEVESYIVLGSLRLVSFFCRSIKKGGGVGIYMKPTFDYKVLDLSAYCIEQDLELCAIELASLSTLIISLYRSPTGNEQKFIEIFESLLTWIHSKYITLIICGDYNIHFQRLSSNSILNSMKNLVNSFGLYVINQIPTRLNSCIDNILSNLDVWQYTLTVTDPLISDHKALVFKMFVDLPERAVPHWAHHYVKHTRLVTPDRLDVFKRELCLIDWGELCLISDPKAAFAYFFRVFNYVFNRCFPLQSGKLSFKYKADTVDKSWYSDDLRK